MPIKGNIVAQGDGAGAEVASPGVPPSQAAPDPSFYVPPNPLPAGQPGDIIRSRPAKAGPPSAQAVADAWTVMYLSQDVAGRPIAVTGTILVP